MKFLTESRCQISTVLHHLRVTWDLIHLHQESVHKYQWFGLPWWFSDEESTCQCRRHGLDSLAQEDSICLRANEPVHNNYWACALEPKDRNRWAHVLQLLESTCSRAQGLQPQPVCCNYWGPRALEPMFRNKRSHCNERPVHRNKE